MGNASGLGHVQVEATECRRAIATRRTWVRLSCAGLCVVVAVLPLLKGSTPNGQWGKHLIEGEHTGLVPIRVLIVPSEPVFAQLLRCAPQMVSTRLAWLVFV